MNQEGAKKKNNRCRNDRCQQYQQTLNFQEIFFKMPRSLGNYTIQNPNQHNL